MSDIAAVSMGSELCNAYGLDVIGTGACISLAMEAFENGCWIPTRQAGLRFALATAT